MRLKVLQARRPRHSEAANGIAWASSDEMISIGDDHKILKWNTSTMDATLVSELPSGTFPTSIHWFPRAAKGANDLFAMTSSDGKLHLISKVGKSEKTAEAHRGAALCCRWSPDGTGLLTGGEDGAVKMWSRQGMLRSVLAQLSSPVYCVSWDGTSSRVVYSSGDSCFIKSLKTQIAAIKWKAHEGIVLCCDWSPNGDLIVTGAEDSKFKVWDSFGRLLFSSSPHDFPITSVSWSPDGQLFAVGSFNILRLCDKAGWSHSLEKLSTGSVVCLAWSPDGTQLGAGCAGGHVLHAHLIDKRVTFRNIEVVQTKPNIVEVRDFSSDVAKEKLETRERVTRFVIGYDHLVLVTTTQIYVFSSKNWNTPVIVELKEKSPSLVMQSEKLFLVVDGTGLYVFNYEGRHLCELKVPGGAGVITEATTGLSSDTIAIKDRSDPKIIYLLDPNTSKQQGDGSITHETEVTELAVSQCGSLNDRMVAFRDKNANVFLAMVKTFGLAQRVAKIGSMAEQLIFNDATNMLAGVSDGKIMVWPAPSIVFVDRSLLQKAFIEKQIGNMGKFPQLLHFTGNHVVLRRSDGSLLPTTIPPFPAALLGHVSSSKWDHAIRLCRLANSESLWAVLAGLAAQARNLYAAEIAYGALDEGEKVSFLTAARQDPNKDVRNAMLLLLAGKISDGDSTLERSGHAFDALMLNVKMFRWSRALDIAMKNKKWLEIAVGYRQRYLQQMGKKETDPRYLKQMSEVEIDWEHIQDVIAEETAKSKK